MDWWLRPLELKAFIGPNSVFLYTQGHQQSAEAHSQKDTWEYHKGRSIHMIQIIQENFLSLKDFMAYILKISLYNQVYFSKCPGRKQVKFKTVTYFERRRA